MKYLIKNIYLLFLFLFISINKSFQSEIKMIPDAYMNATACFVSLDSIEKSDYLYFSFDYDYHKQMNPNQKDIAFFKISTELLFSDYDLNYALFDIKLEDISLEYLESNKKNIIWRNIYINFKEKNGNDYDYYIKIKKFGSKNTLIIRIPISENSGQITIENINSLPNDKSNIYSNINNIITNWNNYNNNNNNKNDVQKTLPPLPPKNLKDPYPQWEHNNNNHINNKNDLYDQYLKNHHYLHNHHHKYRYRHNTPVARPSFFVLVVILSPLWIVVFVLYFMVNRKKNNVQLAVVVGNIRQ